MNAWTEHRNPEGRTYWFNAGTKQSVWEKPDELKTPFERALNQTKWKEYFSGGRKYYYNTETKESKWDMPDELLLVLEKVEKEPQAGATRAPAAPPAPGFTPVNQGGNAPQGGANQSSSSHPSQTNGTAPNALAVGAHTGGIPNAQATPHPSATNPNALPARPSLPDDPVIPHNGFATLEEGEKAFVHLLRKAGVDANWTWDQTMRAIITDPLYKALNTLAEKKACWEKYTNGLKVKEQEEREARLAKLRPAIRNMLKGNPNVFYYSTFKTADKLFANHPIWQQAKIQEERKLIFEEYVAELKEREVAETRSARTRSIAKVVAMFKELDVNVVTKWRTARDLLLESEEWNADAELRKLPTLDILLAFEDYSRVREREYEEQMRRAQVEKTRKERKAREAFKTILQELIESGTLKARTKWKEVYPLFKDDNRYLDMLGNPGSNPLELFWDAVDALDQKLDAKVTIVEDVIRRHNASLAEAAGAKKEKDDGAKGDEKKDGEKATEDEKEGDGEAMDVTPEAFAVTPTTTWEEFAAVISKAADSSVKALDDEELHLVFDTLHEQALKKQADEKRRHERRQRHLQEDLRYALKKMPEPIDVNMKYEDAVPLIENLPEYKALEDEEGKRAAFAKFIKRQKERIREAALSDNEGSTTSRKRKEPARSGHDDDRAEPRDHKDRERERERSDKRDAHAHRGDRERERERDRPKDYRSSRHHHRYDDYDGGDHRYGRDKDEYRSSASKYHRDEKRDLRDARDGRDPRDIRDGRDVRDPRDGGRDRRMSRDERGASHPPHWDEPPRGPPGRERSTSIYRDDYMRDKREQEDSVGSDRAEKRMRYDEPEPEKPREVSARAESPEEGEI